MSTAISGRPLESFFGNTIETPPPPMNNPNPSRKETTAFHASKCFVCPDGKDVPVPDMILREQRKVEKPTKQRKAAPAPAPKPAPVILSRQGPPQGYLPDPTEIGNKDATVPSNNATKYVPVAPVSFQQNQSTGVSQTQLANANSVLEQLGLLPSK